MSKSLAIAIVFILAFASQAIASEFFDPRLDLGDDRYFVTRLFDMTQVALLRNVEPTAFIFSSAQGDSVKIVCEGSNPWFGNDVAQNEISIVIKTAQSQDTLRQADLGRWIAVPPQGGKAAILVGRKNFGEKQIVLKSMVVFCKSVVSRLPLASTTTRMLEINHLSLPKAASSAKSASTVFFITLKEDDQYKVQLAGSQGLNQPTAIGYVFKTGEEFAKQPLAIGVATSLPASGKGSGLFGFEFSELPNSKGTNDYHIGIDRIPMGTTGQPSTQNR
jgi:hypothetical protein